MRRLLGLASVLAALVLAPRAGAQGLGSLVSPGKLAKPHAKLEGLDKCQSCHEPGHQVTAALCLACHKPVAERIKARKGVHRDATGNDCASCHVEHAGVDGDLLHFEPKGFDHKGQAGFALDGLHAPLDCKACHKTRSYLGLGTACATCHKDVHNGTLGATCQTCHPTNVAFKDTRKGFDHATTKYALTGKHATTPCESCHKKKGEYRIAKFGACEDCHKNPHVPALGVCSTCHVTDSFKQIAAGQKFDHAKTGYPLRGRHAAVACEKCHVKPATLVRLRFDRCADCHIDAHNHLFAAEDCAACHTEAGFKPAKFDHTARTKFPLDGRHSGTACVACHKTAAAQANVPLAKRIVEFRGAKKECVTCHVDVHKGTLGPTCETCHGTSSFRLSAFQHPRRPEFFLGAHAGVTCEKCHLPEKGSAAPGSGSGLVKGLPPPPASRQYRGVAFECATCHKDPHLGQVGPDCARCHGLKEKGFKADLFSHGAAKFPLTGKHETTPCAKCHAKETAKFPAGNGTAVRYAGLKLECNACHKDPHLGQLAPACETCHGTSTFKVEKYAHPRKKETTDFFVARHATVACAECHHKETGDFPAGRGTAVRYALAVDCAHCHEDVHHGALGRDCASCHNSVIWRTASRAFHKTAAFTLEGRHLAVPCASCHIKGVLKGTPLGCYDCHWIRKPDDRFKTKLGADCQTCHQPIAWTAVNWSHAATTGFNLDTPHKTLDCEACHKNQVFPGTPTDCYSCHRADYERVQNPNHVAGGFPTDCTGCHKASAPTWQGATFTHATFPLAGVHTTQPCAACHVNNVFKGTPRDCFSCHRLDYQNSKNPPHASQAFPTTCDSCHKFSDPNWLGAGFNHNTGTTFPLVGVHITTPCTTCHTNNNYTTVPTSCYGCHQKDVTGATSPVSHAGLPTTCDSCHKPTDQTWLLATAFNHATFFPLAGAHATAPCAQCHTNGNFLTVPASPCTACHQTDYNNARTPVNHTGLPTTCESCHNNADATWLVASAFNHATFFPLAGAHVTAPCAQCHTNGNFLTVATSPCSACHQNDYNTAKSPVDHVASNFPTTCDSCHKFSDATWLLATFSHTTFPLVGPHATAPCAQCHNPPYAPSANNYTTVPTSCYGCHVRDFNTATTPVNHAGLPTTCDSCHKNTDQTWLLATAFNHATYFPLAGAHVTAPCAQCHTNGNFLTVATSPCSACHQNDYNNAKSPVDHVASNFPTTCDSCHKFSDATWLLATFSHTTFPLVGPHATAPCAQCHNPPYAPSANNYTTVPTSCYGCHVRDFTGAATPVNHAGLPTTCDTCHKNTDQTWLLATAFNHGTYFALAGAHATAPCAQCHNPPYAPTANNFVTVPTSPCSACHQNDYNNATTPVNHIAQAFPTTCDSCHKFTDATWLLATFSHTTFPLVGPHATAPCAQCHNPPYAPSANNYTTVPTSCYGCHVRDFTGAATPVNHAGLPTTCDSCHKNTDTTWLLASAFNHATYFALVGPHATAPCAQCHNPPYAPSANNFLTVPTGPCSACHMGDYASASTPVNHAGMPTTCDSCHKNTDTTWLLATAFSHATYFALAGAHATAPCGQCHNPPYAPSANNFVSVPTGPCSACHMSSFTTATTPVAHAGFPTTCDTCHKFSDTSWLQGVFNHTSYFPLTSNHNVPCAQCHTTAGTYAVYNCIGCHTAAQTNSNHSGVKGYVWASTACYACHPNGRAG